MPFEQTSSLLHAFLIACVSSLSGLAAPASAKAIEAVVSILILSLSYHLISARRGVYIGAAGTSTLAFMPNFAYWSWGGLETSAYILLSLIQCIFISLFLRNRSIASLLMLLSSNIALVLLRPESLLVLPMQAIILTCLLNVNRQDNNPLPDSLGSIHLFIPLISSALVAIVTGFIVRSILFGRLVPSTVLAKSLWHPSFPARFTAGLIYVFANPLGIGIIGGVAILPFLIFSFLSTLQSRSVFSCAIFSLAVSQSLSAVIGGGDWMEMGRFLVSPVFLLLLNILVYNKKRVAAVGALSGVLMLSALFYVRTAIREISFKRFRMQHIGYFPIPRGLSIGAKVSFWGDAKPVELNSVASLKNSACMYPFEALKAPNLRDCYFLEAIHIGQYRKKLFSINEGDKIMSYQAGMVPYYLITKHPKARFIDPIGLGSPERTVDPSLAFSGLAGGRGGVSEEVFFKFVDRFNPEFIFDLVGYRQQLMRAGYLPVVTIDLASSKFPYNETFYVRRDRLRQGALHP